jgi:SAM-dependent methyltransferase
MLQKSTNRPIPWPKIQKLDALVDGSNEKVEVPLKENYYMEDMAYLDTDEAYPLFEKQARIIKDCEYKKILDVGCRHGPVNKILHMNLKYTDYLYFGFDTSEEPINVANETWKDYDNIQYRQQSWEERIDPGFIPDVIIFSGVLLYIKDDQERWDFFDEFMFYQQCSNAIIQEPYHFQRHWDDRLILNTITKKGLNFLYQDYNVDEHYLDLPIFAGKRVLYHVTAKP